MADDRTDMASSLPLTAATKRQQLNTSTETLSSSLLPALPFDVISEILCRLPVKLLLQLSCLCKSWKSLISDPKFTKKHLCMSTTRHHIMVTSTDDSHELVLFGSPISSVLSISRVTQTQLSYPSSLTFEYGERSDVCSCDGILCINVCFHPSAILWNPSIRKFKVLPPLEKIQCKRVPFSIYSFGYDHFIDNYKIIVVSSCINKSEVCILTLGTDYWRRIKDFPYDGPLHESGIFVSGTVNWLAIDNSSSNSSLRAIVSLDLENESYKKLPHPDLENELWTLGVLTDCLCIFTSSDIFFDIWVMKEYGNKESWTKLYNVPYMEDRGLSSYTKVLYVSEDDKMLMEFYELGSSKLKLVVYDSKNGTLKIPVIQNINRRMDPKVYIESLISPCS